MSILFSIWLCLSVQAYYYCAIVEDVILRFAWTIQISLSTMTKTHSIGDIVATVLAPLEVFRWVETAFPSVLVLLLIGSLTDRIPQLKLISYTRSHGPHSHLPSSFHLPIRRFVWNFFRLENEHLNNCGEFRAVRDISVAPLNADDQTLLEQMMDQEDGVKNRSGKKAWKRSYSLSLRRPLLSSSQ